MRIIVLFFGLFLIVFPAGGGALAQSGSKAYADKPLPDIEMMEPEGFESQTQIIEETPFGMESLAYHVRLPQDWVRDPMQGLAQIRLNTIALTPAVRYHSADPSQARSRFTLSAMQLDFDLTAMQWLIRMITEQGIGVEGIAEHGPGRAEILFVRLEAGQSVAVRAIASVNGPVLIFAEYAMPIENWAEEKIMQAQAMESFRLKTDGADGADRYMTHNFLDIASFGYPESWQLRAPVIKNTDRMSAALYNITEILGNNRRRQSVQEGRIEIQLISRHVFRTLPAEIDALKSALTSVGLSVDGKTDNELETPLPASFEWLEQEIFAVSDDRNLLQDYEFWLTAMRSGDYTYFITLITPARDEDFLAWSRNSQTYKQVVASLKSLRGG